MYLRKTTLLLAAAAILGLVSNVSAQSKDVLRWKFEKGQKFTVVSDSDAKTEIDTPMGAQEIPNKLTTTMTWEVVEAKDGNFKIKQTVDRIKVKTSIPFAGDIEWDSDDEDSEPEGMARQMVAQFKKMVGKSSELQFNSRGQVKKKDKEESKGGMSMNMAADIASQMFIEFPEGAVQKGKSWEQKISNDIGDQGSMTMKNKYTFQGKEKSSSMKEVYKIGLKGEIEMEMDQGPVSMETDEGKIDGTLFFDAKAGHLVKAEISQKIVMSMDAGGQNMTMTSTGKSKMTITPKKDKKDKK